MKKPINLRETARESDFPKRIKNESKNEKSLILNALGVSSFTSLSGTSRCHHSHTHTH